MLAIKKSAVKSGRMLTDVTPLSSEETVRNILRQLGFCVLVDGIPQLKGYAVYLDLREVKRDFGSLAIEPGPKPISADVQLTSTEVRKISSETRSLWGGDWIAPRQTAADLDRWVAKELQDKKDSKFHLAKYVHKIEVDNFKVAKMNFDQAMSTFRKYGVLVVDVESWKHSPSYGCSHRTEQGGCPH
jgi:hypothetical protein